MTDHPTATDYRNRADRAEQERDARQPRYGDRPLELWRVRMVEEKVA